MGPFSNITNLIGRFTIADFQLAQRPSFPTPVPNLTGNVEPLGEELDRLVVLTKPGERSAQVAQRPAFPSPVPNPTGNVEPLGEELDRLVVLAKAMERRAQVG